MPLQNYCYVLNMRVSSDLVSTVFLFFRRHLNQYDSNVGVEVVYMYCYCGNLYITFSRLLSVII
jgi:hypothetical protein